MNGDRSFLCEMRALKESMIEYGIAAGDEIVGCTEREIAQLEEKLATHFPPAYRAFLLSMGKGAGRLFMGTDIFFGHISELRNALNEAVAEARDGLLLPADAVVFMSHQGIVFMFFRTSEGDDPPVYRYCQGDGSPIQSDSRFTEFLSKCIIEQREMQLTRNSFRLQHGRQ